MAKFIKSFFTPEKKKSHRDGEGDEERDFTPPLDGRRNLSISRSGRMRQANKKRSSLTMDLYGERLQVAEKPKSREYHVNNPVITENAKRNSVESADSKIESARDVDISKCMHNVTADMVKTPEEEIELAFEIIDKVS